MSDQPQSIPHEHVKGGVAYTCYCSNPPVQPKTTDGVTKVLKAARAPIVDTPMAASEMMSAIRKIHDQLKTPPAREFALGFLTALGIVIVVLAIALLKWSAS